MEKVTLEAIQKIENEMALVGFINDSYDTDRLLDEIADDLIPIDENERKNLELKELLEDHMVENYKLIKEIDSKGDYRGYYYDTEKEYESIDEFKKDYKVYLV